MAETMREEVRLTRFSHGAGCACKLAPSDLARVLALLTPTEYPPEVLVSPATGDDASVYVLPGGQALIQTVDFFTPIVDDGYDWGRIAAANALSDVYAMGGRPLTALNIVAWPVDEIPLEILANVLEGGAAVAKRAGVAIVGGHSIRDPAPKYGMAVTGIADARNIKRNSTMRAGDHLFLTKPIGVGIITTAAKAGAATPEQVREATQLMTTLNADAGDAMVEAGASAATDITGFGLLGHLQIALRASGLAASVDAGAVPVLAGVRELADKGFVPGGTRSNHDFLRPHVDWAALTEIEQFVLADSQTSGGLLVSIGRDREAALLEALRRRGIEAARIGVTEDGRAGTIRVAGRLRR